MERRVCVCRACVCVCARARSRVRVSAPGLMERMASICFCRALHNLTSGAARTSASSACRELSEISIHFDYLFILSFTLLLTCAACLIVSAS